MLIDGVVILIFVLSFWIGWLIRIYIDWLSLIWVALITVVLTIFLPYFMAFVDRSSADFSPIAYYVFGFLVIALIFVAIYLLIGHRKSSSSGLKRGLGSLVLAMVSGYSLIIVLVSMAEIGWIDISDSSLMSRLPNWILSPLK